jgi:hypothetical protein
LNKTTDTNLWGIHAGKTGDADRLFLKKYCVAVNQLWLAGRKLASQRSGSYAPGHGERL